MLSPYIQSVPAPDPLLVFDRTALRLRRARAAQDWSGRAFLKQEIATRLVERLDDVALLRPAVEEGAGDHGL